MNYLPAGYLASAAYQHINTSINRQPILAKKEQDANVTTDGVEFSFGHVRLTRLHTEKEPCHCHSLWDRLQRPNRSFFA